MHPVLISDMLTHSSPSVMTPEDAGSATDNELAHMLAFHLLLNNGVANDNDDNDDDEHR